MICVIPDPFHSMQRGQVPRLEKVCDFNTQVSKIFSQYCHCFSFASQTHTMRKGLVACYTSVCSRRMKSCAPIRLQNVMIHMFIHPFCDVTFRKMELEAVIDKVTLDMGYESLKAKQKEAIMLFFLQKRRITNRIWKRCVYYIILHLCVVPGTN